MASPFEIFLQRLTSVGLEYFRRYYGLYRSEVMKVDDPETRGRIQIRCPEVGLNTVLNKWVDPAMAGAGTDRGWFWPPEVGDSVWVSFERGDPSLPNMYLGGWFGDKEVPSELGYASKNPKRRGFTTRTGHSFIVNEEAGKESVEIVWRKPQSQPASGKTAARNGDKASLEFDSDGSITLTNKNSTSVKLDAKNKKIVVTDKDNSNTITMDSKGVTIQTNGKVDVNGASQCNINAQSVNLVDGADTFAVRGVDAVQWLGSHTHGTAVGPTSNPIQAASLSNILSKNTKLK